MNGNEFQIKFSVIIAVYNRSDELLELLESLDNQSDKEFEVIVVDDGSKEKLSHIVDKFEEKLNIKYYYKENSGAGLSRNFGCEKSTSDYFIFLDSDCILPEKYIYNVRKNINNEYFDAFGGGDVANKSFNSLQKAISYSMTSFFTTGGIRGNIKSVNKFQPRSFNMGVSKKAFSTVDGFSEMRVGEDPDLSMKLWENGFTTVYFDDISVFHKRRTSLMKFAKQVYHFGIARPILDQRHPDYKKITFWFPSIFLLFFICSIVLNSFNYLFIIPLALYYILIFIDSSIKNNIIVGVLSIITTSVQFFFYGFGFLQSFILLNLFKISAKKAFPSHYYLK